MPNIIDYIKWRGDVELDGSPFNDIDCLILSQIAMIDFSGIIPAPFESGSVSLADAADAYFSDAKRSGVSLGAVIPPETKELFKEAGKSARFGGIKLMGFVSHTSIGEETQFAALTAELGDNTRCIIFRGTDDTIVGWKEDLNLSYMSAIPAQLKAVKYLEEMTVGFDGQIRVGGHSKGGNLSVYAATKVERSIQDRIIAVYNHDAPGFKRDFLSSPEHERIEMRISTVVPQSSIVGMLFENKGHYLIVKSTMSGIMQHNPFSWEILGKEFIKLDSLTAEGQMIARAMNDWIAKATIEECQAFSNALYKILVATEATTLTELKADKYAVVRAIKDADKETRSRVFSVLGIIFEEGGKIFKENLFGNSKKKKLNEAEQKKLDEALVDAQSVFMELRDGGEIPSLEGEERPKRDDPTASAEDETSKRPTFITDLANVAKQVINKI